MTTDWPAAARALGPAFLERAAAHDHDDSFVADNYVELKAQGFAALAVPEALGGGGASYADACHTLRVLAQYCPSTSLALSMHTHLVAANVWKYKNGKPGAEPLLRKVAVESAILVSTGATDWLDSNGSARRVEGGYRVSGRKVFASGCLAADLLITSTAATDEPEGPSVLHFPLSTKAEGVRIVEDWRTLGMRGSGSHSVLIEDAFVPESAIVLKRPQGKWHPVWELVLGVAPAIYMSPYMGLAEAAAALAVERARQRPRPSLASAVGELENALTQARLAWTDMIRLVDDYRFTPSLENSSEQLVRKTLVTQAVQRVAHLSLEVAGGSSFYRTSLLERLWRDAQAAPFHPLPERRQLEFCGRQRLGLDVSTV
jgi:alkylation response protein AidB-like acyl-CoA dehydrogenase